VRGSVTAGPTEPNGGSLASAATWRGCRLWRLPRLGTCRLTCTLPSGWPEQHIVTAQPVPTRVEPGPLLVDHSGRAGRDQPFDARVGRSSGAVQLHSVSTNLVHLDSQVASGGGVQHVPDLFTGAGAHAAHAAPCWSLLGGVLALGVVDASHVVQRSSVCCQSGVSSVACGVRAMVGDELVRAHRAEQPRAGVEGAGGVFQQQRADRGDGFGAPASRQRGTVGPACLERASYCSSRPANPEHPVQVVLARRPVPAPVVGQRVRGRRAWLVYELSRSQFGSTSMLQCCRTTRSSPTTSTSSSTGRLTRPQPAPGSRDLGCAVGGLA
jgi:hypothetical protein